MVICHLIIQCDSCHMNEEECTSLHGKRKKFIKTTGGRNLLAFCCERELPLFVYDVLIAGSIRDKLIKLQGWMEQDVRILRCFTVWRKCGKFTRFL